MLKGNPSYAPYKQVKPLISLFNLAELHYFILREQGKSLAKHLTDKYRKYVISISVAIIKEANKFRYNHRRQKISTADAIGYITAKKYALKILTGDNAFAGMENLEFVK